MKEKKPRRIPIVFLVKASIYVAFFFQNSINISEKKEDTRE